MLSRKPNVGRRLSPPGLPQALKLRSPNEPVGAGVPAGRSGAEAPKWRAETPALLDMRGSSLLARFKTQGCALRTKAPPRFIVR